MTAFPICLLRCLRTKKQIACMEMNDYNLKLMITRFINNLQHYYIQSYWFYEQIKHLQTTRFQITFQLKMKPKTNKKQRLGNNPYLLQDSTMEYQHQSPNFTQKLNRLNNSPYSPEEYFDIPDLQTENKQLKITIEKLKETIQIKQHQSNLQLHNLNNLSEEKQQKINQLNQQNNKLHEQINKKQQKIENLQQKIETLQQKIGTLQYNIESLKQRIKSMQQQTTKKDSNIKQKLIECEGIVKELEQKQLKSNAHTMLQSSRIDKLNFSDQNNTISLTNMIPQHNLQSNFKLNPVPQRDRGFFDELQENKSLILMNRASDRVNNQISLQNNDMQRKSPTVIFKYTPPKNIFQPSMLSPPSRHINLNQTKMPLNKQIHQLNSPRNSNHSFIRQQRILSPSGVNYPSGVTSPINYLKPYAPPQNFIPINSVRQNITSQQITYQPK